MYGYDFHVTCAVNIRFLEKDCDVLDTAGLVGSNLCQGKKDYKSGWIFHGLFLALCLTINDFGNTEEQKTFRKFENGESVLDGSQNFSMRDRKKISYATLNLKKNHLLMDMSYRQK